MSLLLFTNASAAAKTCRRLTCKCQRTLYFFFFMHQRSYTFFRFNLSKRRGIFLFSSNFLIAFLLCITTAFIAFLGKFNFLLIICSSSTCRIVFYCLHYRKLINYIISKFAQLQVLCRVILSCTTLLHCQSFQDQNFPLLFFYFLFSAYCLHCLYIH